MALNTSIMHLQPGLCPGYHWEWEGAYSVSQTFKRPLPGKRKRSGTAKGRREGTEKGKKEKHGRTPSPGNSYVSLSLFLTALSNALMPYSSPTRINSILEELRFKRLAVILEEIYIVNC